VLLPDVVLLLLHVCCASLPRYPQDRTLVGEQVVRFFFTVIFLFSPLRNHWSPFWSSNLASQRQGMLRAKCQIQALMSQQAVCFFRMLLFQR